MDFRLRGNDGKKEKIQRKQTHPHPTLPLKGRAKMYSRRAGDDQERTS
jgi:hypothetical protein